MKKKILTCLLAGCMLFALGSCMNDDGEYSSESASELQSSPLTSESLTDSEESIMDSQESSVESEEESSYQSEEESNSESEELPPEESEEESSLPSDVEFPDVPLD